MTDTVALSRWACFFRHKWTAWSEPYNYHFTLVDTWKGKSIGNGVELRQWRQCTVCGAREERTVR